MRIYILLVVHNYLLRQFYVCLCLLKLLFFSFVIFWTALFELIACLWDGKISNWAISLLSHQIFFWRILIFILLNAGLFYLIHSSSLLKFLLITPSLSIIMKRSKNRIFRRKFSIIELGEFFCLWGTHKSKCFTQPSF